MLTDKQAQILGMFGLLEHYATYLRTLPKYEGYRLRPGYGLRSHEENERVGGHKRSTHLVALARDYTVEKLQPPYPSDDVREELPLEWTVQERTTPYHRELHRFWEAIGGAKMITGDSGHFSLTWRGVR